MLSEPDEMLLRVIMIELINQKRPCSMQRIGALLSGRTLGHSGPPGRASDIASKVLADQIASDRSADEERLRRVVSWAAGRGLLEMDPDKMLYQVTAAGKRWAIKVEKRFGATVMLMRDELHLAAEICRLLAANDGRMSMEEIREEVARGEPPEAGGPERVDRALTIGVGRGWIKHLDGKWRLTARGRKESLLYLD